MRFAHYSAELTKAAKFKDRRSKIGLRADGTQLVRLAGEDMTALREEVFEAYGWDCAEYRYPIAHDKEYWCDGPLELSHNVPRSLGGSDTAENTRPRCRKHHRLRDGHGQPMHF